MEEVAKIFVGEKGRSLENLGEGFGRESTGAGGLNVRWANRGRGRTPYPGIPSQKDRRGVFKVTERG